MTFDMNMIIIMYFISSLESVWPGVPVHEERKMIKVVARAARYEGGWSEFSDITLR